eukprot:TRINITY_DN12852_c0_g1_i1.p1 TRINITY_DN12852_c0_g1~~TRINITY_DN12852_c0_g1_i1.p1  ORF type:complete len:246 (-),score=42.62 TRINITY_DN12852_c0_g1_i1:37-774(-)
MNGKVFAVLFAVAAVCLVAIEARSRLQVKSTPVIETPRGVRAGELCEVCINAMLIEINELLNIIANEGILGDCGALCGKLPKNLEADVCDVLCDAVGLDLFIRYLERSDIDPIYMCELIDMCKIVDCQGTCLTIDSFQTTPPSGKFGTTFNSIAYFSVDQQTGTGMTRLDLYLPDGEVSQDDQLEVGFKPGNYSLDVQIPADESQGFMAGQYTVQLWFCEGECGSHHPHSKVYDVRNSTFVVTGK